MLRAQFARPLFFSLFFPSILMIPLFAAAQTDPPPGDENSVLAAPADFRSVSDDENNALPTPDDFPPVPDDEHSVLPPPDDFRRVPDDARPWAYYWWLKGNVTKESITRDLTDMRNLGFGGVLVFDSRGYHEDAERHIPVPLSIRHEFMSPSWRELMIHLIAEADRLGMKVSLNLSNTGGHLRGPWDFGSDGPRTLMTSVMKIDAGEKIEIPLTPPKDQRFFKDVALLAVRVESAADGSPLSDVRVGASDGAEWKPAASPEEGGLIAREVQNLSDRIVDGKIAWRVPDGDWRLVRFGSAVIGDVGSVDILNADIIARYFDKMAGTIIRETDDMTRRSGKESLVGRTLTHFYNVSWEGGNPNWTDGFERFFAEKRGYAIDPYLPILAGMTVTNRETVERFMIDFHKTVADAFCENCYRKIGRLCHENGLEWHSEDGGPWNRSAPMFVEGDMLTFWGQNDIAQGEFWMSENGPNPQTNLRFAASAAHIYGRRLVAAEAFTHMTHHWTMYPAILKPAADRNFIDGANMFLWHTFTASPPEAGRPGYEYFAGTHINSNVTWQRDAPPFIAYLGRCQTLLRKGDFVADFCAYVSDKNYTIWGRGEKWNPDSRLKVPSGCASDFLNSDVLIRRLEFRDGLFRLPGGMAYRFLVLDPVENDLPLSALEKIVSLVRQGGAVLLGDRKPTRCRGLSDGPQGDRRLSECASLLWGDGEGEGKPQDAPSSLPRRLGKGKIYSGVAPEEMMRAENVLPDFEGPFEYHHRTLAENDVYFVVNSALLPQKAETSFRTNRRFAALWDPVTGETTGVSVKERDDGRSCVTIDLAKHGSVFVVFSDRETAAKTPPDSFAASGETIKSEKILDGPWSVSFDPAWGGPSGAVAFDTLTPWNESGDDRIRYYSGTATYRKTFTLTAAEADSERTRLRLDLGSAGVLARVRVNGLDGGVVWTDPWQVDFHGGVKMGLKEGENRLEIDVTNCWANRLIGDAGLPPERRLTRTNVQYYPAGAKHFAYQGYAPDEPLRVSGLLGPVRLILEKVSNNE